MKLGFVYSSPESLAHWTTERLFKRVGLNPKEHMHFVVGPELLKQIESSPVQCVVLFGESALQTVLGKTELLRWFNRVVPLKLNQRELWAVPCLAPDQLLAYKVIDDDDDRRGMRHPPRYTGIVASCVRKALQVATDGWTVARPQYLEDPSPAKFKAWVDGFYVYTSVHPDVILSSDIETAYKLKEVDEADLEERQRVKDGDILRISFAYKPHEAVSIPWQSEYKADIKRLLAWTGQHCGWNSVAFDVPVLATNGCPVGGLMLDGMDGWHLLQTDLDKGLEFVSSVYTTVMPWKHLSDSMPALYSCIDSDIALQNVLGIQADLRQRGLWERFEKEMRLMAKLREAGEYGNYIDEARRLQLKARFESELYTKLREAQSLVKPEFKRHKLYKRKPKQWQDDQIGVTVKTTTVQQCNQCGKRPVSIKHKCPDGHEWEKLKVEVPTEHYYQLDPLADVTNLDELLQVLKTDGFNPCSATQMKAYMKAHKHPVGKNWKTDKDSADVKHVKKLVGKYGKAHPIYAHTLEIRKIQKALSTYINGLAPDDSGLVHCTYVNSPSTWRLGCRNFNAQNLGKRNTNQYAKESRQIIVPRLGHVLVTADSSSIEAVFVGHFMRDENYKRLAAKGIHSFVTCKWLGWEFTPENVDKMKAEHTALYDMFKTINHGCLTGDHEVLTPNGWVRFDEYDFVTPILEWSPDGHMEFKQPLNHVKAPWKGNMVTIKGAAIDAIATPDHAFPVRSVDNRYGREYVAKLAAAELEDRHGSIPVYGVLDGDMLMDSKQLQLMVAVQADGHITKGHQVTFNFHKQRKVDRLKLLLEGRPYTYKQTKDGHCFYIPREAIADVLELLDEHKTFRLAFLLSLTAELRELVIEELTHWDGCRSGYSRTYLSCNKTNIDIMQTVAFSIGRQGLVREKPMTGNRKSLMWELRLNKRKYISIEQLKFGVKPHDDLVYCVTTSTGYFVTRHNGSVYTTSNTNFGMGPYMMYMNEPEKFPSIKEAEKFQQFLFEQLPGLREWHMELRLTAKKQGYLDNPWGLRHYFYDVFTYQYDDDRNLVVDDKGQAKIKLGRDANKVIAFKPQSSGGMFMRDNLLRLADTEVGCYMPAVVSIHDGYTLDVPEAKVQLASEILVDILTRPIEEMDGLRVGCEVEVGYHNFGKMEKLCKVEV